MTVDKLFSEVLKWSKRLAMVAFIVIIAVTGVELAGFNVPGIKPLPLTQNVGIAIAGIAYFLKS